MAQDVQEKLDLEKLRLREIRALETEKKEGDKIKKLNDYHKRKEEEFSGSQVNFQIFYKAS